MPYTRVWNTAVPGNVPANTLDDEIRNLKVDLGERLDNVIGSTAWTTAADPVVNGTTAKSLTTLTTEIAAKPTINTTNSYIPVRTGAGVFGDSNIQSSGNNVTINGTGLQINHGALTINSVLYGFPNTQGAAATILRNDGAGVLSWITIASLGGGDITGSGTSGRIAKFNAAKNIVDSLVSESGSTVTVGGSLVTTGPIQAPTSVTVTGGASGNNVLGAGGLSINTGDAWARDGFKSGAGATKVVGNRVVGWAAPSGPAERTTFDTATVTTAGLAARVKALLDDLTTHGLIGA